MEDIYPDLYIGGDEDYERLKDEPNWAFLRCAKDGPGGHRHTLGYTSQGAPKDKHYLFVRRPKRLALNIIDAPDPNLFPRELIDKAIDFIGEQLGSGKKVLVACNHGHSRGPTIALLYLRSIGEYPYSFIRSEMIFKTLYPKYSPNAGIRQVARSLWSELGRAHELEGKHGGTGNEE
jgi:predicted protein tyrosine phosphatase